MGEGCGMVLWGGNIRRGTLIKVGQSGHQGV